MALPEYWRFDPSGGQYHGTHLAADRLVEGVYQPIDIVTVGRILLLGSQRGAGTGRLLGERASALVRSGAQRYLRTFDEEAEERVAAEERVPGTGSGNQASAGLKVIWDESGVRNGSGRERRPRDILASFGR